MSVTALIGLPRSGKSTWSKGWLTGNYPVSKTTLFMLKADWNNSIWIPRPIPSVVVCADDIRLTFGSRYNENVEPYVDVIKHTMIKVYHSTGYEVLVDGTHTTWKSIEKLLLIDPETHFEWIWPLDMSKTDSWQGWITHIRTCKERALMTNQKDLIPIIDRMANQLEELSKDWRSKLVDKRQWAREYKEHVV